MSSRLLVGVATLAVALSACSGCPQCVTPPPGRADVSFADLNLGPHPFRADPYRDDTVVLDPNALQGDPVTVVHAQLEPGAWSPDPVSVAFKVTGVPAGGQSVHATCGLAFAELPALTAPAACTAAVEVSYWPDGRSVGAVRVAFVAASGALTLERLTPAEAFPSLSGGVFRFSGSFVMRRWLNGAVVEDGYGFTLHVEGEAPVEFLAPA